MGQLSNGIEQPSAVHRGPLKGVDMAKDDKTTKVKGIKGKRDKGQSRVDSKLFEPFQLRGLTMRNRIWLPPMDTYSVYAQDGKPTPFQIERKKPPRFAISDVVHENSYRIQDAVEMTAMLKKRQSLDGEAFDRWIMAFAKRKWNCDFSREMTRSAAQMIREWGEGK